MSRTATVTASSPSSLAEHRQGVGGEVRLSGCVVLRVEQIGEGSATLVVLEGGGEFVLHDLEAPVAHLSRPTGQFIVHHNGGLMDVAPEGIHFQVQIVERKGFRLPAVIFAENPLFPAHTY